MAHYNKNKHSEKPRIAVILGFLASVYKEMGRRACPLDSPIKHIHPLIRNINIEVTEGGEEPTIMDLSLLFFVIPLLYLLSYVILFWVFVDAKEKHGTNIGCLWALIVFTTGPLGLVAYLIVRNAD